MCAQMRLHHAHARVRRARPFPGGIPHPFISGLINFLDLQDAAPANLLKRALQTDQNYADLSDAARNGASLNMTYLALSLSTS